MDEKEFQVKQPDFYRSFSHALKYHKIPQAYLLWGSPRCDFVGIGRFIAQSLMCERGSLACNQCDSCKRFLENKAPDFVTIKAKTKIISKDQIVQLKSFFSMTSVENGKRMCYLIINCQNLKNEAANALLKFLEEPHEGITAILTAPNIEAVLPTIVSRCEAVKLRPVPRKEIYEELNKEYSEEIAYFLSDYSGDKEVLNEMAQNKDYLNIVSKLNDFILAFNKNRKDSTFTLLNIAGQKMTSMQCYNWFYMGLDRFLSDCLTKECDYGPYKDFISQFNYKDKNLFASLKIFLERTLSMSVANLSFVGISAQLIEMILKSVH